MRKINLSKLPDEVIELINEESPMSEDIGIFNDKDELTGVIITPDAYSYFLKKVEEDEDKEDLESLKNFDSESEMNSAITIDDFLNSEN
jgi:hypothetical protein